MIKYMKSPDLVQINKKKRELTVYWILPFWLNHIEKIKKAKR